MRPSRTMASIIAKLTARPGKAAALEAILRKLVAATAAEPGAVVYDLHHAPGQENVFFVTERYASVAARESHLGSEHLRGALAQAADCLAGSPDIQLLETLASIRHESRTIGGKPVQVAVLPIGPVNLVYAQTPNGLLGCGAIDPAALERFGLAAARVKPAGASVARFEDPLNGTVREANAPAQSRGIRVGMTGEQALALF